MFEELRILLIDDNAADRALASALLREELSGAIIHDVNGAVDFAELLGYRTWTVAIAERELSWADGGDLLRAIKARHPRCQTILFAKQPPDELGSLGHNAGVDAYVRKESAGYLRLPLFIREARSSQRGPAYEGGSAVVHNGLRGGLDAAPVGYFWVLADGTLLETNPAFATLLGVTDGNALKGRSLLDFLPNHEARARCERSLLRGAREQFFAVSMDAPDDESQSSPALRPGREARECSLSFWPVPDPKGRACLEGMAWELSSPQVAGPSRSKVTQEPRQAVGAGKIDGARKTSSILVEPTIALATPIRAPAEVPSTPAALPPNEPVTKLTEHAGFKPTPPLAGLEHVPLKEALLAAMERLRPQIAQANARIRANQLPVLLANGSEMTRLFRELIENSIKYRSAAPPLIQVRAEEQVDGWLISVGDNGAGISAAKRKTLFGPNHDGPAGGGLTICRHLAKRYRGEVWLTSQAGLGTTVFVAVKARSIALDQIALAVQFNGEAMGEIAVRNASNKREIARAALAHL